MEIKRVVAGIYGANCYIIMDKKTKEAVVIDPGGDVDDIEKAINSIDANVKYILLTHGHLDHTSGVAELKKIFNVPVCISKKDDELIACGTQLYGPLLEGEADIHIKEGDVFSVGEISIRCIETPGHTPGGMSFIIDGKSVFTGDTLFYGSIGRTDLEGGDFDILINSITKKLMSLDDNIIVYPGHGPQSTIMNEKNNNPFLKNK
ncbi:putative metallo-hydrolase [Clostridium tepidiprofundi DSM 19306]|uniref:Putative metallo-hydrolase n=1 Tax=Clostridium tepidiprofundi DSM 19306 TaxID=1121338 RepID=A0A151B8P9_9CLOT|nr:MBL fold metallo-hydrolase [Clostridium tepidiprofundi]KYH36017.1 putative metallo-hydrolase [Clostridium tepidiprofundi DSM 19306]